MKLLSDDGALMVRGGQLMNRKYGSRRLLAGEARG